jgi:xanthine dehydrogenase small subunit
MGAIQNEALLPPRLHQPSSLHEAWELKSSLKESALYVSGGTLLRTQWEAGTVPMPSNLIDLGGVEGIGEIRMSEFHLTAGALTTLSECRRNGLLQSTAPAVQEAARCIAAPAVRNLATLGGNISSGYGDILPALLVYNAELVSYDGKFLAVQPLTDWLNDKWGGIRPAADIVTEVRITPFAQESEEMRRLEVFRKVGRREAFTASLVTVAITASIDAGNLISGVRIAAGGGSGRPQRIYAAEALLEGKVFKDGLLSELYEAVLNGFETYSDPFATDAYKRKTAANLIVSELWKAAR